MGKIEKSRVLSLMILDHEPMAISGMRIFKNFAPVRIDRSTKPVKVAIAPYRRKNPHKHAITLEKMIEVLLVIDLKPADTSVAKFLLANPELLENEKESIIFFPGTLYQYEGSIEEKEIAYLCYDSGEWHVKMYSIKSPFSHYRTKVVLYDFQSTEESSPR